ncbi:glycosyltransferase family 2 protein [Ectobacillus ponti]|uniref:Glycosyltransferase family 2 protein n=1 Tax=Ectobacillus ponti TaxID=2961894 RepID=A0AA41X435_9BACI|nr:glycosyltransferase family 2 protein [Ectobacillus ponti]MCP8968342.1 glycosyltransferase family 2 protein [Ectobacillus ponti]
MKEYQSPTISLCMIVKDEAQTLARCLDSVSHLVDEIIIVDTGSTDETVQIASAYTLEIHHFPWIQDFAAARNFAFSKATMEYILWLDADDMLLEEDQRRFAELKSHFPHDVDSFLMDYHIRHDEQGRVTFSTIRTRLVRRAKQYKWVGRVHETLQDHGAARAYATIAVTHGKEKAVTSRNLQIYESMLAEGAELTPRDMFHYAFELLHSRQVEAAGTWFARFLELAPTEIESRLLAHAYLADCHYLAGRRQECLQTCLQGLQYGLPRRELIGRICNIFIESGQYEAALPWARFSLELQRPAGSTAAVEHMYYTWLPHIQLCACYLHRKDYENARLHLQEAKRHTSSHPVVRSYEEKLQQLMI